MLQDILQNMDGNPTLTTVMTGGNFAVNGNGKVSFNVANHGNANVQTHQ